MKKSAGILVYRKRDTVEVFLVHPGGPFYAERDEGVWSIPKGEYENEEPLEAAKREFKEETNFDLPGGELITLTPVDQGGIGGKKKISAWAIEGDLDPKKMKSNTFSMWGKEFPEVDRGEWLSLKEAQKKIAPAQRNFLKELETILSER